MDCERCGNECYDNTQKNALRAQQGQKPFPLYKCKDSNCGWVKWPPRQQGGGNGRNAPSVRATRPLGPLYHECARIASATIKKHVPNATPADIVAGIATLFIGATSTGAPLVNVSAPQPPPPPPPPKPPSDNFEDEPGYNDGDPDSLPF